MSGLEYAVIRGQISHVCEYTFRPLTGREIWFRFLDSKTKLANDKKKVVKLGKGLLELWLIKKNYLQKRE